jgi:hypothetical protein
MGKFKEMDLLRQEREAFDADYPMEPPPRADVWVAWNSEDGFTFWDNEQQAILWSADGSIEWPVKYVMPKAQPAPVQKPLRGWWAHTNPETGLVDVVGYQLTQADKAHGWIEQEIYTTPPAAHKPWVGLVDENGILDFGDAHVTPEFGRGVLWAQSRLKEKNRG